MRLNKFPPDFWANYFKITFFKLKCLSPITLFVKMTGVFMTTMQQSNSQMNERDQQHNYNHYKLKSIQIKIS